MAQSDLLGLVDEPQMTAALLGTARDIEKRININLRRLAIGQYNPKRRDAPSGKHYRMPGTMQRSIYWQIFNATGGGDYKIKFWMEAVANYVELAVQGAGEGVKGKDGKFHTAQNGSWRVRNGGLPAPISRANYGGIKIDRTNSKGKTLKRKAKPFIGGEVRVHGRMLFDRLVQDYAYVGNVIMASAVDVRKILPYFDEYGKNTASKEWSGNPRDMDEILADMAHNRNTDVAALVHQGWNPLDRSSGDWDDLRISSDRTK